MDLDKYLAVVLNLLGGLMKTVQKKIAFVFISFILFSYTGVAFSSDKQQKETSLTMPQTSAENRKIIKQCLDGLVRLIIDNDKNRAIQLIPGVTKSAPYMIYFTKNTGDDDNRRGLFLNGYKPQIKNFETEPPTIYEYQFTKGGVGITSPEGDYVILEGTNCIFSTSGKEMHVQNGVWYKKDSI